MGEEVTVLGAGVVGQVLAVRLARAGHHVTLVARGERLEQLSRDGVRIRSHRGTETARLDLQPTVPEEPHDRVLFVAVRREQVGRVLAELDPVVCDHVVLMSNHPSATVFPGYGGYVEPDGTVRWAPVPHQPTTINGRSAAADTVEQLLRGTGLPTTRTDDMASWLATHLVFATTFGAAIQAHGGAAALAADAIGMRRLVKDVRSGLHALRETGRSIEPRSIETVFCRVPTGLAARYWARQLRGEVGRVCLEPHVLATADTELPELAGAVADLLGARTPRSVLELILDD